jgi:uncharacterized protein YdiU (UPF0061 family)
MTDIIIVGYPKSRNTWVTRLIAELVVCPVVGFWDRSHSNEIAREGLNRLSEFRCFKSHHQLHQLQKTQSNSTSGNQKIIYVIRDPRDITISGAHYFLIEKWFPLSRFFSRFPKGKEMYKRLINPLITPKRYRIEQMVHAVLYGSEEYPWLRASWSNHYKPYMESQFCFVKV